jgi:hypothetical protein
MAHDPLTRVVAADRGTFCESRPPSSHVALQRVVVRMLFDPGFVERVYQDPASTLDGLDLPEHLVNQLVANDRRLWGADRLRRRRALKVLMEEFKVASTLYLALAGRLTRLEGFFSSQPFHDVVQRRGYMALAYVAFLEEALGAFGERAVHGRAALDLEAGMARSRRLAREVRRGRDPIVAWRTVDAGGSVALAASVVVVEVPGGTLDLVQHVEAWLFEVGLVPAVALCTDAPRPEPLPDLVPREPLTCLLEHKDVTPGEVGISVLDDPWRAVVRACQEPRSRMELETRVGPDAAPSAWSRVASLVEAGVLRFVEAVPEDTIRGPAR